MKPTYGSVETSGVPTEISPFESEIRPCAEIGTLAGTRDVSTHPPVPRNSVLGLWSRMETKPFREITLSEIIAADGREFLEYWRSKRTGPGPPPRRTLDPLIEKPYLAPCMYIYEAVDGGRDFRLRLVGTQVVTLFSGDPTGRCLTEIWASSEIETNLQLMRKCMGTGEPVAAEGSYHWRGRAFIEWQCVITPLRLDGPQVEQFLCFLSHLPRFKVLSC